MNLLDSGAGLAGEGAELPDEEDVSEGSRMQQREPPRSI
jgi:hypothetical protein